LFFVKKNIHSIFMFTAGYFQNHSVEFNVNLKDSRSSKTMQHTNQRKKSGAICLINDMYTVKGVVHLKKHFC